jgi:hypothetical protein
MKLQTALWVTVLAASVAANVAVRSLPPPLPAAAPPTPPTPPDRPADVAVKPSPPAVPAPEVRSPEPPPGRSVPPPEPPVAPVAHSPEPPALAGDVLVLVVETDLLGKGDTYLKKHLSAFQQWPQARLLGGSIYLLDATGKVRPWDASQAPAAGSAAFHARDGGDVRATFSRVVEALDGLGRRAGGQAFETLLVWKSDVDAVGRGDLDGVRKPSRPVMLYWLTARQPGTEGFNDWLGRQSVTCEDPTRDENLAADMKLYLEQKRKP